MKVWTSSDSPRVRSRAMRWLEAHGIDDDNTYMIVFMEEQKRYGQAWIHRYKNNANGQRFVDPKTGDIAIEKVLKINLKRGEYKRISTRS